MTQAVGRSGEAGASSAAIDKGENVTRLGALVATIGIMGAISAGIAVAAVLTLVKRCGADGCCE